jgi:hypothetical protein
MFNWAVLFVSLNLIGLIAWKIITDTKPEVPKVSNRDILITCVITQYGMQQLRVKANADPAIEYARARLIKQYQSELNKYTENDSN